VNIADDRVIIRGEYRGSRHGQPDTVMSEWTIGPYYRELVLVHAVNGALTNAAYGNGVLALSMPKLRPGEPGEAVEFQLEAVSETKGQRVGHSGSAMRPTTTDEHRQRLQQRAEP
jgi:hypothetical protein